MTNKERTFLEANKRWKARKAAEVKRNPAYADYKAGKITWTEYLEERRKNDWK